MKEPSFAHINLRVTGEETHTLVCDELKEYYGKPLYWLPHKFDINKIKTAFLEVKKDGDRDFSHLMQKLQ